MVITILGVAWASFACDRKRGHIVTSHARLEHWPNELLGRRRNITTDWLIVYAHDRAIATELSRWVEAQASVFRREYGIQRTQEIVVFALEPGEEPVPAIEEWRQQHVSRRRLIEWGRYRAIDGRPYCMTPREPDFRESFVMPGGELRRLGAGLQNAQGPALVFFLTSDEHKNERFERTWSTGLKTRVVIPYPFGLRELMDAMTHHEYKTKDLALMRLQRREALWTGLSKISHDCVDTSEVDARITRRTDDEYRKIWESRRRD